jgi:hypothetical protein
LRMKGAGRGGIWLGISAAGAGVGGLLGSLARLARPVQHWRVVSCRVGLARTRRQFIAAAV